jgi:hypothetical protein
VSKHDSKVIRAGGPDSAVRTGRSAEAELRSLLRRDQH